MDLMLPVNERDHTLGPENAPVTLVEYGDYECPHCARARDIVERIMQEQRDNVRFVFRNFPLMRIHPNALDASLAAEAADKQNKFWEMHGLLFDSQEELDPDLYVVLAKRLGLVTPKFAEDMHSEEVEIKVLHDIDSGFRSGVYGTPTFFINGRRHDDSYHYEVLAPAVEQALASAVKR